MHSVAASGQDCLGLVRPPVLKAGDSVAVISHSWGGPSVFPHQYELGKKQLQEAFGLKVVEAPHALRPADELAANPKLRADDLMWAFSNPEVKAVISSIGGDDAINLLKYVDLEVIRSNPKVFLGYSDSTVIHLMCLKAGLSSVYGPAIMAGFGESGGLFDYMRDSVRRTLFSTKPIGEITPNTDGWTDDIEVVNWAKPETLGKLRPLRPCTGNRLLQGNQSVQGNLIGGCLEVLEMAKGSSLWPELSQWEGAIFFIETSEEGPPPDYFARCLRNYGASGILDRISGLIVGRAANVAEDKLDQYDEVLQRVIANELGQTDLPILTQMDFGHTDPMFLMPYGARAEINVDGARLTILDPAVSDG